MAILCCCPQLLHTRRPQTEEDANQDEGPQGLPARPPPARLPPPVPSGLALSPQSTPARSSLTNPLPGAEANASVHVAELVIEDSDDSNSDAEVAHTNRNRSTSTLEAVKARIRRHLSQDSIPGPSESEEQIARRAEVKRLMRKRIQEELQSENSPVPGSLSTVQHTVPPDVASVTILGNGPRDTIEFTVDELTTDKELARAIPAHFSNSAESDAQHFLRTIPKRSSARSSDQESRHLDSRPVSLCDWIEHDLETTQSGQHRHVRKRSSLPELPGSPQLQPVRVASLHDTGSLASWRLSLSADRLAGLITPDKNRSLFRPVVSPGDSFDKCGAKPQDENPLTSPPFAVHAAGSADKARPSQVSLHSNPPSRRIPKSSSLVRDESPVGLWLRAQSQHFRLSTASPLQSEHQSDDEPDDHAHEGPSDQLSEPRVATAAQRRHDLSSSSRGSLGPTWEQSPSPAVPWSDCEAMQTFPSETNDIRHGCRDKSPLEIPVPATSHRVSQIPTPVNAGPPLQNGVQRALAGIRLPSFRWHHLLSEGPEFSKLSPPPKPHPGTTTTGLVRFHTKRTTLETGSGTSGLGRGETELQMAEGRSPDSHRRTEPFISTGSKFQEVLSDNPRFAARNSLLSKLELTLPGDCEFFEKFDGNDSDHGPLMSPARRKLEKCESDNLNASGLSHLKVPSTEYGRAKSSLKGTRLSNNSDASPRTRGFSSSRDGDETAEMWKRALRAESVSRSSRRSTSTQPVILQASGPDAKVNSLLPRAPCPSEIGDRSGSDSVVHSPTCTELPTQNDEEFFRQSLFRSNIILEEWGRQLGEQEQEVLAKTHNLPSGSRGFYKKSIMPPLSWARFPSHNREERNAVAGEHDCVKPRDFAVKEVSAVSGISWTTDKEEDGALTHRSIVRSVSDRFTQPFKSRWSKLLPRRADAHVKDRSILGARRSSIQASADLEFPELELLPTTGGYRELLALEREISEMKGVESKMRLSSNESGTSNNRRSLIEKMTEVLQHDGGSDVDDLKPRDMTDLIKDQASLVGIGLPVTPANQTACSGCMHGKEATDSSGERYATPFTHFSVSRPLTPQTTSHLPAAAHTPGFTPSTTSVIRHMSLHVQKTTLNLSITTGNATFDLSSGRSNIRRHSAPPVSPGF